MDGDSSAGKQCVVNDDCSALYPDLGACEIAVCDTGTNQCSKGQKKNFTPCDDNDACTTGAVCFDGSCDGSKGTLTSCDDGNPCTADECDGATGCSHEPDSGCCDDGYPCTSDDVCAGGECAGTPMGCACNADADCAQFEDGDLCNGTLHCTDGACTVDPESIVTCDGSGDTTCSKATCSPVTGECELQPAKDGTACDDGSSCTSDDQCQSGACASGANQCPCEKGADCDSFEDGNKCNGTLTCFGNHCVIDPATVVACEATGVPCRTNVCSKTTGTCEQKASPDGVSCSDGDLCSVADKCSGGACKSGAPASCDDGDVCTNDSCDPSSGCASVHNTAACDDGDPCTESDVCGGGVCGGVPKSCDDGNACTNDSCDAATGCVNQPGEGDCDDGDPCTTSDTCAAGECVGAGELECDDGNPCTEDGCEGGVGCVGSPVEGECDDGSPCTQGDACAAGACVAGQATSCDDGDPCTDDGCLPETGCESAPGTGGSCEDGNACTDGDECLAGDCVGGPPTSCDDGDVCTNDSCDPQEGCVHTANTGATCDDADACTKSDTCVTGACEGTEPVGCDDGNGCTNDSCDPATGCVHANNNKACDDADACTSKDQCIGGECVSGAPDNCSDGNPCTVDSCDPAAGCVNAPLTGDCEDGNACTTGETCVDGACGGGLPLSCDDGNVCTADICKPASGCSSTVAVGPCDDGDPCTPEDACANGVCVGGGAADCDDGNVCTTDSCAVGVGCTYADADGAPCDDGYSCTVDDTCVGGVCSAGTDTCECQSDADCQDDDNHCNGVPACDLGSNTCKPKAETVVTCDTTTNTTCSTNACNPSTGLCAMVPANDGKACSDGDLCTSGDACDSGECAGTAVMCDDGNVCTADSCMAAAGGCVFAPAVGATCDDGDACTVGDSCEGGSCVPGADGCPDTCVVDDSLLCGDVVGGDLAAAPNDLAQSYSCNDFDYSGAEQVYSFVSTNTGSVTVALGDETAEMDLLILGGGDGCDPAACIDYGFSSVAFMAEAGQTYYIVVDGYQGATGTYSLSIDCASPCEPSPTPGCGGCDCETCVCELDSFCCGVSWDDVCVSQCVNDCGYIGCPVTAGCCEPHNDAGCLDEGVEACVCEEDPFCCTTHWDAKCVSEVEELGCGTCGSLCPGVGGACDQPNNTPGCDDVPCCETVCASDPYCCEAGWDVTCVTEAANLCIQPPGDCPGSGGGCFESNGTPGCDDVACCATVCAMDAYCCATSWDNQCVLEATESCSPPADCPGEGGDCKSANGTAGCADVACCYTICGADPYCCTTVWDQTCASQAKTACGGPPACPGDGGDCHSQNGTPGCDDVACCEVVCATDDFCCTTVWDGLCVAAAADLCGGPPVTSCCEGGGDTPGCGDVACEECVCETDAYCCNAAWDSLCVDVATDTCAPDCGCGSPALCPGDGGSCFSANGGPGCTTVACCQAVCAADELCCTSAWDELCVAAAAESCGPLPDTPCCQVGAAPSCGDEGCEGCVCALDSTCCESAWDESCVAAAAASCQADCGCVTTPAGCPGAGGDCFGDNGTPGCDDAVCCAVVCEVDDFCCTTSWDGLCAAGAADLCGAPPESPCCVGGLDAGGCGDASCEACACAIDPYCCETAWDLTCGELAAAQCPAECGCSVGPTGCPGAGGDCFSDNGTPGCGEVPCCEAVCAADGFCCESAWDAICAAEAGVACNGGSLTSCEGYCDTNPAAPPGELCYCDEACLSIGDCCDDACAACGICAP